jgi:DNA-binding LacI/PurR family transcriptional regulator
MEYKGMRDSGLAIPVDISVVGCDDIVGSWIVSAIDDDT